MQNNMILFNYEGSNVRTVTIDGEPWFVLKDVCDILGIRNSRDAADRLDDDEKNTVALNDGIPGNPNKTVINESGLYNVILRSDKPEAKKFRKWITNEVLPSIRKTGGYLSPEVDFTDPNKLMVMLQHWAADRKMLLEAQPKIQAHDALIRTERHMSITDCAKHFGLPPKSVVFPWLREHGFLTLNNLPTQKSINEDLMVLKETVVNRDTENEKTTPQAVVETRQLPKWNTFIVPKIHKALEI